MEWVKLYTTFHDHRKTVELDANAIALWTLCLSWSGAQDTDGFIPRRIALRFLAGELGDEAAARLVRVGLWEAVDGGYRMANWDGRQATVADRDARRAQWRERKVRQKAGQGDAARAVHASDHAGFTRESCVPPATREEERREDERVSPPSPPRGDGGNGSPGGQTPTNGHSPTPVVRRQEADFAAEYACAFSAAHAGRPPARSLVTGMASEAQRLREEGHASSELLDAVHRCAELNRGPRLLPLVLAEVQSGTPRPRDRPGRPDLMDRWERINFGARR
jgi:hypothetical protein